MAIKVQSVTGAGATLVLNGVATGNTLSLQMSYLRSGSSTVAATPADSNGTFAVASADPTFDFSGSGTGVAAWYEKNTASGTHTVTPDAGVSKNCTLTEWSGLDTTSPFDVAKSAGTSNFAGTSQVTGTTATTAQANELVLITFVLVAPGVSNVGLTDPVANYTTLQVIQNDSTDIATHHSYRIISATGTQSATENWTDTETGQTSMACIATFKDAATVGNIAWVKG